MKYIALSGKSSFARGVALGKMIKDVCIRSLSFFEQKLAEEGLTLEYGLRLALENEKVMAKHFPELLEEIRGVARALNCHTTHYSSKPLIHLRPALLQTVQLSPLLAAQQAIGYLLLAETTTS